MIDNLVSVIMPAYNAEKYIAEAIASVLAQTYTKWELLIVDDCSTDATAKIVKQYQEQDHRIKLYYLTENQGVANARNIALQNAAGRYVAFLDSDDIWLPEKLSQQIEFMQTNNYVFTYHDYRTIRVMDNILGKVINVPLKVDYKELLKGNNTGSCLSTCVDRKVIDQIYMPNAKHEDYICWLEILKKYQITAFGINECLAYYRVGKKSVSSNKLKSVYWTWKVYRENQQLSMAQSIYYMFFYIKNGIKKRS